MYCKFFLIQITFCTNQYPFLLNSIAICNKQTDVTSVSISNQWVIKNNTGFLSCWYSAKVWENACKSFFIYSQEQVQGVSSASPILTILSLGRRNVETVPLHDNAKHWLLSTSLNKHKAGFSIPQKKCGLMQFCTVRSLKFKNLRHKCHAFNQPQFHSVKLVLQLHSLLAEMLSITF